MSGERVRHARLEARRADFESGGGAQGGVGVAGGCWRHDDLLPSRVDDAWMIDNAWTAGLRHRQ